MSFTSPIHQLLQKIILAPNVVVGWFCTFLLSFGLYYFAHWCSVDLSLTKFMVVFIAALSVWIFRLLPEYIPALIIILSAILLQIAPKHILLSGFISDSFFLAISVFIVSAVITKSGLFNRLAIQLLVLAPFTNQVLQKLLFALGLILTPVLSIQSSRVALMAPLLDNILEKSKIHPKSPAANALANVAFNGCILLSTVFLSGKSSNFVLLALLKEHNNWQGGWYHWLIWASVPGILLILLFLGIHSLLFKTPKQVTFCKFELKKELVRLGRIRKTEKSALLAIAILVCGVILATLWGISPFFICITLVITLVMNNSMSLLEFKQRLNWSFLFYFGAIVGIMQTLQSLGLELWIQEHMHWLINFQTLSTATLIILIYSISWLGGLLLGTMTAPAILFTALIPLTQYYHLNSWIVAFVILMATEAWIFPYQSSYFLCFEGLLQKNRYFCLKPVLKTNALFSLMKLAILLVSIPFWRYVGLVN